MGLPLCMWTSLVSGKMLIQPFVLRSFFSSIDRKTVASPLYLSLCNHLYCACLTHRFNKVVCVSVSVRVFAYVSACVCVCVFVCLSQSFSVASICYVFCTCKTVQPPASCRAGGAYSISQQPPK